MRSTAAPRTSDDPAVTAPPYTVGWTDRVARAAVGHVRWVLAAAALVVVVGVVLTSSLGGALTQSYALPGQPGYEANQMILAQYGGGGAAPPTVVAVQLPAGSTVQQPSVAASLQQGRRSLAARLSEAAGPSGGPRVVGYDPANADALVSADGRTSFVLIFDFTVMGQDPGLDQRVADRYLAGASLPRGTKAYTTGVDILSNATETSGGGGASTLVETLIGAAGALVILIFVFGSFIAIVPMIIAAVSILGTFSLVRGLTTVTEVSAVVQYLVALIGLGVAIDYSLLVVTRWREERARGLENRTAVLESVRTAGRSVVFSGVTVAIGLLALVALPVPFLRSVGYGAVLIPLVSIGVSLTLLPALLAGAGPFLDRPHRSRARPASAPSPGWTWWTRRVIRFRWLAAVVGLGVLSALVVPALSLRVGSPQTTALETGGPPTTGIQVLRSAGIGTGVLTPIEILTSPARAASISEKAARVPGVRSVVETGRTSRSVILDVLPEQETSSEAGAETLHRVQAALSDQPAQVGGTGANSQAFNHAVYGSFPAVLAVILLITLALLARAFRSLVLAAKAVALNLLSVAATYGFLTLVWQEGHGSDLIWNVPATGAVTNFIPLMVFAFLFGLSMDYEVFILARMREAYDAHRSTDRAIVEGLGHTGKLVTSAALILFLSFLSLSQVPLVDIKVFATGLGGGILLDATIVRALLVPALVSLFGRWNWWLPAPLARVLRVEASQVDRAPHGDATDASSSGGERTRPERVTSADGTTSP